MFGYCKHKKLSKIKDGYQYCEECNKAFPVECNHKYRLNDTKELVSYGRIKTIIKIYECKNCGQLKIVTLDTFEKPTVKYL